MKSKASLGLQGNVRMRRKGPDENQKMDQRCRKRFKKHGIQKMQVKGG